MEGVEQSLNSREGVKMGSNAVATAYTPKLCVEIKTVELESAFFQTKSGRCNFAAVACFYFVVFFLSLRDKAFYVGHVAVLQVHHHKQIHTAE